MQPAGHLLPESLGKARDHSMGGQLRSRKIDTRSRERQGVADGTRFDVGTSQRVSVGVRKPVRLVALVREESERPAVVDGPVVLAIREQIPRVTIRVANEHIQRDQPAKPTHCTSSSITARSS